MNKLYGSLIMFFFFFKYPIIIYILICFYLEIDTGYILNTLGLICTLLVIKDLVYFYTNRKKEK